jgi:hypothetical protein
MLSLRNVCINYEDGDRIHPAQNMTESELLIKHSEEFLVFIKHAEFLL